MNLRSSPSHSTNTRQEEGTEAKGEQETLQPPPKQPQSPVPVTSLICPQSPVKSNSNWSNSNTVIQSSPALFWNLTPKTTTNSNSASNSSNNNNNNNNNNSTLLNQHRTAFSFELSPFPASPIKGLSTPSATDCTFPNSAFISPVRTKTIKEKKKNVSFEKQQQQEQEQDVRKEASLCSSIHPPQLHRYPYLPIAPPQPILLQQRYRCKPSLRYRSSQQKDKSNQEEEEEYSMEQNQETLAPTATETTTYSISNNNSTNNSNSSKNPNPNTSGPYSQIVNPTADLKPKNDDTPPRDSTEKEKKVAVISPPEVDGRGHNRSASYNTADFPSDLPNVPDSPYSPHHSYSQYGASVYPSPTHLISGYSYPLASPVKGNSDLSPKEQQQQQKQQQNIDAFAYSSQYGYHHFAPPGEEQYKKQQQHLSPGKRQRVNENKEITMDILTKKEENVEDHDSPQHPPPATASTEGEYATTQHVEKRDFYSEYDSDHYSRSSRHPPVTKAASYTHPASPNRYELDGTPGSSSNSYPGARRPHPSRYGGAAFAAAASEYSYYQEPQPPPPRSHGPPPPQSSYPPYDYHDHAGYYESPHRPHHTPRHRPAHAGYYYDGQPPPHTAATGGGHPRGEDIHPLLRDYDPDRDRNRHARNTEDNSPVKHISPDRPKVDNDTVASTPSLKSRSSKSVSPNKPKPSTAAKAAIAAGMTQPPSASEVDFDIHNPPLTPITPPSLDPACSVTSNINNNDVLCGRGGGTNTQIGNRRFRSLVQEFQPTYLLCRRKEKPLIARTIVLIIRHRGGRFLKKDEGNGMLFEVGDEKAEAKTSQALREGLDVRASKSTTLMGRKKQQRDKKKKELEASIQSKAGTIPQDDMIVAESPMRSQRDGPPPQHEYSHYPPPPYYYGYGGHGHYPPYHYGYEHGPAYVSPSRKRQRAPDAEPMYYPPPPYKGYPPYSSYPPEYHYDSYSNAPPPAPPPSHREENPGWEMDFNPPRGSTKKDGARLNEER